MSSTIARVGPRNSRPLGPKKWLDGARNARRREREPPSSRQKRLVERWRSHTKRPDRRKSGLRRRGRERVERKNVR